MIAVPIVLVVTGIAVGAVARGFFVGRAEEARRAAERARRQAEGEREAAEREREYLTRRLEDSKRDQERLTKERDEYRRIAETHEIRIPEVPEGAAEHRKAIWRERSYANHPSKNLEALESDLEPHLSEVVALRIRVEPTGGWKQRLRRPVVHEWKGLATRVLEEVRCYLMDDDFGLMERSGDKKIWADEDSPLRFHVDLDSVEEGKPDVLTKVVEVLRVQTDVEERVVEKPLIVRVPVPENSPVVSREEVETLVEHRLNERLRQLGLAKVRVPDTYREPALRVSIGEETHASTREQGRRRRHAK